VPPSRPPSRPGPAWPAARCRCRSSSPCGLDLLDAYQLVTQAVESPLANVCDTNYTSIAKMPKRYLGSAFGAVMDGAHARLRDLAESYRS